MTTSRPAPTSPAPTACDEADGLLAEAAALQADGYLGRALPRVARSVDLCPSDTTRLAHARALADLWLDDRAIEAYKACATGADAEAKADVAAAVAELERRPPHVRDATYEQKSDARLLYQAGQLLRVLDKNYALSLQRFEESYAAWPHPLTIVQMGLTHRAAGRDVEYRKANARALAVAVQTRGADARAVIQTGHFGAVQSVAFHPERPILASGSDDQTIILWDLTSGRVVRSIGGSIGGGSSVAFSPDGALLVSARGNQLMLWDVVSGEQRQTFAGHTESIKTVAFSPDGTLLASGGYDDTIELWDVAAGAAVRALTGHTDAIASLTFSPNGTQLASASRDKTIKIWDVGSGAEVRTLTGHRGAVLSVAFSSRGVLASASEDATVKLWDANTGAELDTLVAGRAWVTSVAFNPDGSLLATASGDDTIRLWDVGSGTEVRTLSSDGHEPDSVTFSPDGSQLASAGKDATSKVWDVTSGEEIRTLAGRGAWVNSVAFGADGTTLASASEDSTVRLWDLVAGNDHRMFNHGTYAFSVSFDAGLTRFAYGGRDHIGVWDLVAGAELHSRPVEYAGRPAFVTSEALSRDGTRLASAGLIGTAVTLSDVATGTELRAFDGDAYGVTAVEFGPDGTRLASAHQDATIKLWDVESGNELRTLTGHGEKVDSLAFSPDGQRLASAAWEDTIRLWDVASGEQVSTLTGHEIGVTSVCFSPDGAQLVSAGASMTLTLWDLASKTVLRTFTGHDGPITSVAFSVDGKHIASSSDDNTIKLWEVGTGALAATLFGTMSVDWMIAAPDGRVDGSPGEDGGESLLYWQIGDVQLPGFVGWQRYHTPGLLGEIIKDDGDPQPLPEGA